MTIQQQAWELKQQGLSYAEIAQRLGIGKSTAYKYVKQWEKRMTENKEEPVEEVEEHTEEYSGEDIANYVEPETTRLEVASVDRVVEEINKKITVLEEPRTKVKKVEEENESEKPTSKIKEFVSGNKLLLFIAIVAVVGIIIAAYFILRPVEDKKVGEIVEEKKQEVEKGNAPVTESTYDHLTPYGITEKEAVVL